MMMFVIRIIAALAGIQRGIDVANAEYADDAINDAPITFVGGRQVTALLHYVTQPCDIRHMTV